MHVYSDPALKRHVNDLSGVENPERLPAAVAGVEEAERGGAPAEWFPCRPAGEEALLAVHAPAYLGRLRDLSDAGGGYLDPDTALGPGSFEVAALASGAACGAVESALGGEAAFAVVRPPGHHAGAGYAMGFCLLNHAAVAAARARALGVDRVAVLDWDIHHGNGTQDVFFSDGTVLYLSVHRSPFYPGTGEAGEVGDGEGRGFTVNVPLPARSGEDVYAAAFAGVLVPVLREFGPGLVIVSAGYDAHAADPLGGMGLEAGSFGRFAALVCSVAREAGGGSPRHSKRRGGRWGGGGGRGVFWGGSPPWSAPSPAGRGRPRRRSCWKGATTSTPSRTASPRPCAGRAKTRPAGDTPAACGRWTRAARPWPPSGRGSGRSGVRKLAGMLGAGPPFRDRRDAGEKLAGRLSRHRDERPAVFALPRGGVPVGYEVARALDGPLDVIVARKLGAPDRPEFGIGAVAPGGVRVLNRDVFRRLGIPDDYLDRVTRRETAEVERRLRHFRGDLPEADVSGRTAILVDDGLATGVTARAAVEALRLRGPERIVLAVPVCAAQAAELFRGQVDELVCLKSPPDLGAIGFWYRDFGQTADEEVVRLLERAR